MKLIQIHPLSALVGAGALGLALALSSMAQTQSDPVPLPRGRGIRPQSELEELLSHISIVYLEDGQGGSVKTIRFTGVNVQIVNGLGATNGYPADCDETSPSLTRTNGAGNLVVGYNDTCSGILDRTGSHNVVIGNSHTYTSYGGLVLGLGNSIIGPYSAVTGGAGNTASGLHSTVSAGLGNTASGYVSAVSGGGGNVASADSASVSGGRINAALEYGSSISGGANNTAIGQISSISGGNSRSVMEQFDWRAGDLFQDQ